MKKFIPYTKLSKKKRRALDRLKRGSWEGVDPTSRIKQSAKVYDRKKQKRGDFEE
ncbi:MAG: hypothetical protein IKS90_01795 [Clostridia bacterium]|nr:hypothetical protein [Clostridia bacterium]